MTYFVVITAIVAIDIFIIFIFIIISFFYLTCNFIIMQF